MTSAASNRARQPIWFAYRIDGIQHAGAGGDPVAGLLTCAPVNAWCSIINGRAVIEQGEITGLDLPTLIKQHNEQAARLLRRAEASREV